MIVVNYVPDGAVQPGFRAGGADRGRTRAPAEPDLTDRSVTSTVVPAVSNLAGAIVSPDADIGRCGWPISPASQLCASPQPSVRDIRAGTMVGSYGHERQTIKARPQSPSAMHRRLRRSCQADRAPPPAIDRPEDVPDDALWRFVRGNCGDIVLLEIVGAAIWPRRCASRGSCGLSCKAANTTSRPSLG